jgi:signal transduction histidine kinase
LRYDDRLATVLGQPAADARGRAVQWRQLVELLARGGEVSPDLAERALTRAAQLMRDLPTDLLAATARAIAGPAVPAELIALFAARGAGASVALLAAADLTPGEWGKVRAAAADDVLPLLAALEPASGKPPIDPPPPAAEASVSFEAPEPAQAPAQDATPQRQTTLPAGLFRWETGPTGEIDWVEGAPRAALIGRSLVETSAAAFAARLPFADEPVILADEGVLAGEWRWSGAPAFFADTGRFAGYRGLAKREGITTDMMGDSAATIPPAEDDGLRELMHELRTPLNAIIGFGEIIEGQYLGPAHRAYRERASEIVRQARSLSDAVDNLDLAARVRSGRLQGEGTSTLSRVRAVLDSLRREADARQVRLTREDRAEELQIALPPLLLERLVQQFAGAMVDAAVAGEELRIVVDRLGSNLAIGIERATALQGLSEQQILADRGRAGMRFALRMVQGLAAMTGGSLDIGADRLTLLLPLAD